MVNTIKIYDHTWNIIYLGWTQSIDMEILQLKIVV